MCWVISLPRSQVRDCFNTSGQSGELFGDRGADVLGGVAVGQVQQPQVAGGAFDDGPDRGLAVLAQDQVAFVVTGQPVAVVVGGGGPFADRDHVGDLALSAAAAGGAGFAHGAARAQHLVRGRGLPGVAVGLQHGFDLAFQPAAGLEEQRTVDRLCATS